MLEENGLFRIIAGQVCHDRDAGLLPEGQGSDSGDLLEEPAEVVLVFEIQFVGDFLDTSSGKVQAPFCFQNDTLLNQLGGSLSEVLPAAFGQRIRGYVEQIGVSRGAAKGKEVCFDQLAELFHYFVAFRR